VTDKKDAMEASVGTTCSPDSLIAIPFVSELVAQQVSTIYLNPVTTTTELSDPAVAPRFSRLISTTEYIASSIAVLLNVFG
jgi:hypothetical protein